MNPSQIVAVVDDDKAVLVGTASLVRALGWSTRTFGSAEEFLQSEYVSTAACLISDVRMPGMSGVELHNHLRGLGYSVPTIFITAFPTPNLEAEILANGALVLLEKPVAVESVAYWVGVALAKS